MKEKFGAIVAIAITSFDLLYVIYEGFNPVGFTLDIIIMYLAFREYQRMSFPSLSTIEQTKEQDNPVVICIDCGAKNQANLKKCRICGKKLA